MCCWPFVDVVLEDPPPPPKAEEEKKEYHLVSDRLNLVGVSQQYSFRDCLIIALTLLLRHRHIFPRATFPMH